MEMMWSYSMSASSSSCAASPGAPEASRAVGLMTSVSASDLAASSARAAGGVDKPAGTPGEWLFPK
eukprot:10720291-Heterocapsa_arctica.AAC.1